MQTQPANQIPWWVSSVAVPAFFTILGFFVGQAKDWWQGRRNKRTFLEAIAVELRAIEAELKDADGQLPPLLLRLQGSGIAPTLIPNWGTRGL